MRKEYDFLIVGAGLFGAVFARQATDSGKRCLVVEKRGHIAGNAYTEKVSGIDIHKYGAHIFHTNNETVWEYVNRFASFNNYINSPIANYQGKLYNLPFNMNTFYQMWGVSTPEAAKTILSHQRRDCYTETPTNLEEQALNLVGRDIYEKLVKGYTEKQWGRPCTALPPEIIRRLPVRFTFDNNYFNARWQGIPEHGYTNMVSNILDGIEVQLATDYFQEREYYDSLAECMVFTGSIDAYYDYRFGALEYRTVKFETQILDCENYQGNAVVNYTDFETPYTRVIEHKHFTSSQSHHTVVSREYSSEWTLGKEPYYPINNAANASIYKKYAQLAAEDADILFGGRLGTYQYMDMDQIVLAALDMAANALEKECAA